MVEEFLLLILFVGIQCVLIVVYKTTASCRWSSDDVHTIAIRHVLLLFEQAAA